MGRGGGEGKGGGGPRGRARGGQEVRKPVLAGDPARAVLLRTRPARLPGGKEKGWKGEEVKGEGPAG